MRLFSKPVLAGGCIIFALALYFVTANDNRVEKSPQSKAVSTVPTRRNPPKIERSTTQVQISEPVIYPEISQILDMEPADWETKFKTEYKDLDPDFKNEVLLLSGELQTSMKEGAAKESEESGAYAETILLLLKEKKQSGK